MEYEWMGLLNERMSICGMNDKLYAYFCKYKFSVTNFGAKIEASGDPGWCHMGIQKHTVEVNARVNQQRSSVVVGSHGKNIFRVSGWYLRHMNNVRVVSFI